MIPRPGAESEARMSWAWSNSSTGRQVAGESYASSAATLPLWGRVLPRPRELRDRSQQQPVNLPSDDEMMRSVGLVVNDGVVGDPEEVVDGGDEVGGVMGLIGGMAGDGVGRAVDDAAGGAAACQGDGIHPRPVIAAGGPVHLRRAAELRRRQHQRLL